MKNSLTQFVASIFTSLKMDEAFSHTVYEVGIDSLPGFTNQLQIRSQFLVCCECHTATGDSCQKIREKL